MNNTLFAELLESAREGGAIFRGEKEPSRVFVLDPVGKQPDQDPQQKDDKRT
jgi:hypothetical protein